jgi:hypothetical protein
MRQASARYRNSPGLAMTTKNMREKGVKCILKSKKKGSNSCPRPAISLHLAVVDAFTVPTRQFAIHRKDRCNAKLTTLFLEVLWWNRNVCKFARDSVQMR